MVYVVVVIFTSLSQVLLVDFFLAFTYNITYSAILGHNGVSIPLNCFYSIQLKEKGKIVGSYQPHTHFQLSAGLFFLFITYSYSLHSINCQKLK